MSRPLQLHRQVREAIAGQITSGELAPGDRLPSERDLQERFGCARSVIRQALAWLVRDGWVMPAYPRGYYVVGPRIPWLSRLQVLSTDPWQVRLTKIQRTSATKGVAADLEVAQGAEIIERYSRLRSTRTGETWGMGWVSYPAEGLPESRAHELLDANEITYDTLEDAFGRRITSYHERILARRATGTERRVLRLAPDEPVIEVRRVANTATAPISVFVFVGRSDCFEADYLIQA
jgi:DNA-binding GntR family transcriptional regulator